MSSPSEYQYDIRDVIRSLDETIKAARKCDPPLKSTIDELNKVASKIRDDAWDDCIKRVRKMEQLPDDLKPYLYSVHESVGTYVTASLSDKLDKLTTLLYVVKRCEEEVQEKKAKSLAKAINEMAGEELVDTN